MDINKNKKCYGFARNKKGQLVINKAEAKNVRLIFNLFLDGKSLGEISKLLEKKKILSPSGKSVWNKKVISSVLANERYYLDGIIEEQLFNNCQQEKSNRQYFVESKVENPTDEKVDTVVENTEKPANVYSYVTVKKPCTTPLFRFFTDINVMSKFDYFRFRWRCVNLEYGY